VRWKTRVKGCEVFVYGISEYICMKSVIKERTRFQETLVFVESSRCDFLKERKASSLLMKTFENETKGRFVEKF